MPPNTPLALPFSISSLCFPMGSLLENEASGQEGKDGHRWPLLLFSWPVSHIWKSVPLSLPRATLELPWTVLAGPAWEKWASLTSSLRSRGQSAGSNHSDVLWASWIMDSGILSRIKWTESGEGHDSPQKKQGERSNTSLTKAADSLCNKFHRNFKGMQSRTKQQEEMLPATCPPPPALPESGLHSKSQLELGRGWPYPCLDAQAPFL